MLYLSNYFKVNGNKDAWLNDQSLFDFVVKHVVFVKKKQSTGDSNRGF
jgi:hypothetical protein